MARPRTPIGTFGQISFASETTTTVTAHTRFRDYDGRLRPVQATGSTRKQAEHNLKEVLARRSRIASGSTDLSGDSTFKRLVEIWLEDLDLQELAFSTRELYARDMRTLVLPAFKDYTLREISIMMVDRYLKKLAKESLSKAQHAKVVLNLALGLAVRYEAIERNPVRSVQRLRKPKKAVNALTIEELEAVRAAVRAWSAAKRPGPKPDGQVEAVIEVMIGTSGRIGEALAIRRRDIDDTGKRMTVHLDGTIITPMNRPQFRQDHPKTSESSRKVAVPHFTAAVIRKRLAEVPADPEQLIFFSRNGTPLSANNVRRTLRAALKEAGLDRVTPHAFRRTVATTLEKQAGAELAAEMLGHTSTVITKKHYIARADAVNEVTAEILESLAPRAVQDLTV